MIFFSADTLGFYDDSIHLTMPEDARPVTDEYYQELMSDLADGMVLAADGNGDPIMVDQPNTFYRGQKLSELEAYGKEIRNTGFTWNGDLFQIREHTGDGRDLGNFSALLAAARNSLADGATFPWVSGSWLTVDNTPVALVTAADAAGLAWTALQAHNSIVQTLIVKRGEIEALADNKATILAYDVTAGWPSL